MSKAKSPPSQELPCVEVAVAAVLPKPLTYSLPPALAGGLAPGTRVLVPLGRRNATGFVLGPVDRPEDLRIRPVRQALDDFPLFPASMVKFFRWVADYYAYPLGMVIKEALPGGIVAKECRTVDISDQGRAALENPKLSKARRHALEALSVSGALDREEFLARAASPSVLRTLENLELVQVCSTILDSGAGPRTETLVTALKTESSAPARQKARHRALEELNRSGTMGVTDLRKIVPSAPKHLQAMADDGEVELKEEAVFRDPLGDRIEKEDNPPELTDEQTAALEHLSQAMDGGFSTVLLHGVTGSGKTEVYLRAAQKSLEKGLPALVLVPEIALISQTERRFRARFGDRVAVLHSGLTPRQRQDQWLKVLLGHTPLAIGARSAIFAPFDRLGLVVVDEEHDESYKQESHLRYNARDLAVVRARMDGAVAVLGSATPSIQTLHNASTGRYEKTQLKNRVMDRPFPEVELVDLRDRRHRATANSFLTLTLCERIEETIKKGEQALLFLNRRGFANFPICQDCGKPLVCEHCDVSLTYHMDRDFYLCHLCGYTLPLSSHCPSCKGRSVMRLGTGTEKVERILADQFPDAKVARLDRDTVSRKGALVKVLRGVRDREVDILVGTQMIAKGHDFPGITLVGILCADLSLGFPDFRAGERTFQILCQVSGRAGRGETPGKVVVQTYNPDHFCVQAAMRSDMEGFVRTELEYRRTLGYPPFTRLAQVRVLAPVKKIAEQAAAQIATELRQYAAQTETTAQHIVILGPIPSPINRIAGQHRFQLLIKGAHQKTFRHFVRQTARLVGQRSAAGGVAAYLDVDPVFML